MPPIPSWFEIRHRGKLRVPIASIHTLVHTEVWYCEARPKQGKFSPIMGVRVSSVRDYPTAWVQDEPLTWGKAADSLARFGIMGATVHVEPAFVYIRDEVRRLPLRRPSFQIVLPEDLRDRIARAAYILALRGNDAKR